MQSLGLLPVALLILGCHWARSAPYAQGGARCVNVWDEGCINGQLPGAGRDDDFINGGFNPGKRCVDTWDETCSDGQTHGTGHLDFETYPPSPPNYRWLAKLINNARH